MQNFEDYYKNDNEFLALIPSIFFEPHSVALSK